MNMPSRPLYRALGILIVLGMLVASVGFAGAPPRGSSQGDDVAYRWVDEKGVVHYGDRVPPQYAQKERAILNEQGVEVGRIEAPKSPEQLAEIARRQEADRRSRERDAFLLNTYTSVKDIEALRDARLDQLRGQRLAAEQYVESLQARLNSLQARAMSFKPYSPTPDARRMPDDLAEDLVRTANEVRSQRSSLTAKAAEESGVHARFQEDIDRYKQLRPIRAAR
ncbi:MAG TPA: DUF4124 domain-containing protein [Steroidobacteraceae bacterium]|nr:DUF4124 domain-containing protein [Steroidobacteraceae bacterium]